MANTTYHHTKVAEYRLKANKALHKTATLFGRNPRSTLVALFFTAADAITLYILWESFLAAQSALFLALLVITQAACLDLPMAVAGGIVKAYSQKLETQKTTLIAITALSLAAFLLVFIPNGYFRMATRDTMIDSSDGFVDEMSVDTETAIDPETGAPIEPTEETEEDSGLAAGGWLMVLLPLATSICSFVCDYVLSDPLDDKVYILDTQITDHENYENELMAEQAEIGDLQAFNEQQKAIERGKLDAFLLVLDSQNDLLKQIVRILFMEIADGDADAISRIEQNAKEILEAKGIDLNHLVIDDSLILPKDSMAA